MTVKAKPPAGTKTSATKAPARTSTPRAATKPRAPRAAVPAKPAKTPEPAVTAAVPEAVVETAKPAKLEKPKKLKMVRDSFTMPQNDYAHIAALKERCLKAGVSAKKSELLRAALVCLASLSDKQLLDALNALAPVKTGRPSKTSR